MNFDVDLSVYNSLIETIKQEILSRRLKAILSANKELLELYWRIGDSIIRQQEQSKWGEKIVARISSDLQAAFPEMKGLSLRNLQYMKAFAKAIPYFVQQPAAQLAPEEKMMQQLVAQLPWFHLCTIIQKTVCTEECLFYIQRTTEYGWSRTVLLHQMESQLYLREGKAISNFIQTLPMEQSDLAQQTIKDPYVFDFLSLRNDYNEKDLEIALTKHISRFLLELGTGFAFIGEQYRLQVGGDDFYIDLLFYHIHLRCYVVVELKTVKFKPEFAGKLNFYLSIVDDTLKTATDKPTIGILICKENNRVVAEYALRDLHKPIGISEYQLSKAFPETFKGSLPTIEELEQELTVDLQKNKIEEGEA